MLNYLNHLRSRPYRERQAIAFGLAAAITFIIIVVWLMLLFKPVSASLVPDWSFDFGALGERLAAEWRRVEAGWQVVKSYLP